ncbi:hypothetical protein HJC23_011451 [Cyclotella cryptica]|uniref:CN hydrolase domain-containing protein n=1 Tax=Cyclotella cryptica TaxID=29204 RepID=A0ABD3NL84_9STRA|eukprot:CCRYP_020749-RA/>CCRYP_020749-RA protein AED:0.12 eAED:0.12 QI:145/0/0.5/1/1/1/2/91/397
MNATYHKRAVRALYAVTVFPWSGVAAADLQSSSRAAITSTSFKLRCPTSFIAPLSVWRSSPLLPRGTLDSRTRRMSSTAMNNSQEPQLTTSQVKNRVALLQFHVTYDKLQNIATARESILKARDSGARLCVLPECWNSPYATAAFPDYAEKLPDVGDEDGAFASFDNGEYGPSSRMLAEMAKSTSMYIVGGSIPEISAGKIYNTCLIVNPSGVIVGKHRKVHLFDVDVPGGIRFCESETLSAGEGATCFDVDEEDTEKGLGRVGVGICFPEYAILLTQVHQCKVLIFPGAFNLTTGPAHWELLQRARAVDGQCFVLTASPARAAPPEEEQKYPHYSAWGHSTAVSPWGEVMASCDENPNIVVVDLDMKKVAEMRMAIPTSNQKRHDLYKLTTGGGGA